MLVAGLLPLNVTTTQWLTRLEEVHGPSMKLVDGNAQGNNGVVKAETMKAESVSSSFKHPLIPMPCNINNSGEDVGRETREQPHRQFSIPNLWDSRLLLTQPNQPPKSAKMRCEERHDEGPQIANLMQNVVVAAFHNGHAPLLCNVRGGPLHFSRGDSRGDEL